MSFTVRPMRQDDAEAVDRLEHDLFGAGAWSREFLDQEIASPGRSYYVAEDIRGHVVGYAGVWFDGYDASIMTVGVDGTQQRLGVGKTLTQLLIERARELRAEFVYLEVRVDNLAAIGLYEALGFEHMGVRKRYYQPADVDALTMRLALRERREAGFTPNPS